MSYREHVPRARPIIADRAWSPSGGPPVADRESGDRRAEQPPATTIDLKESQGIQQGRTHEEVSLQPALCRAPGGQAASRTTRAPSAQPDLWDRDHRTRGGHRRRAGGRQGCRWWFGLGDSRPGIASRGHPDPSGDVGKAAVGPDLDPRRRADRGIVTSPQTVNGSALVADGKPEMLFIGAEFCPHCAAERWPLYVALSKFGTFSPPPGRIHSANEDGNVPTLTFYGTTFTSPYFTFNPVEVYTNKPLGNGYAPLQTPTKAQLTLWENTNGGSFPFVDFGGKKVLPSAQYLFTPLQNLPFSTVAAQVGNNSTTIGADIDASAAQLITTICGSLSDQKPAAVCSAVHGG